MPNLHNAWSEPDRAKSSEHTLGATHDSADREHERRAEDHERGHGKHNTEQYLKSNRTGHW